MAHELVPARFPSPGPGFFEAISNHDSFGFLAFVLATGITMPGACAAAP